MIRVLIDGLICINSRGSILPGAHKMNSSSNAVRTHSNKDKDKNKNKKVVREVHRRALVATYLLASMQSVWQRHLMWMPS